MWPFFLPFHASLAKSFFLCSLNYTQKVFLRSVYEKRTLQGKRNQAGLWWGSLSACAYPTTGVNTRSNCSPPPETHPANLPGGASPRHETPKARRLRSAYYRSDNVLLRYCSRHRRLRMLAFPEGETVGGEAGVDGFSRSACTGRFHGAREERAR